VTLLLVSTIYGTGRRKFVRRGDQRRSAPREPRQLELFGPKLTYLSGEPVLIAQAELTGRSLVSTARTPREEDAYAPPRVPSVARAGSSMTMGH
jgi:hypothetical protein